MISGIGLVVFCLNEINDDKESAIIWFVNASFLLCWALAGYFVFVRAKFDLLRTRWMSEEEAEKVLKEGAEAKLEYRGRSPFATPNNATPYLEEDPPFLDNYDVSATPKLVDSSNYLGKYLRNYDYEESDACRC